MQDFFSFILNSSVFFGSFIKNEYIYYLSNNKERNLVSHLFQEIMELLCKITGLNSAFVDLLFRDTIIEA
jgi:hypothetical protein